MKKIRLTEPAEDLSGTHRPTSEDLLEFQNWREFERSGEYVVGEMTEEEIQEAREKRPNLYGTDVAYLLPQVCEYSHMGGEPCKWCDTI